MNNRPLKTLSTIAWSTILQVTFVTVLTGFVLSVIYSMINHYQEKQQHIDHIAAIMTTSASTVKGLDIIADQITTVLQHEPAIERIDFYPPTDADAETVEPDDDSRNDFHNALLADSVSINYPIISHEFLDPDDDGDRIIDDGRSIVPNAVTDASSRELTDAATSSLPSQGTDTQPQLQSQSQNIESTLRVSDSLNSAQGVVATDPSLGIGVEDTSNTGSLVGYLNITIDTAKLRQQWLQDHLPLRMLIVALGVVWILFLLRKINWFIRDIANLTDTFRYISENPQVEQLPPIKQRFEFYELMQVRQDAFSLFETVRENKRHYKALEALEQQLNNKEMSLTLQRHNFQSMINHELKNSLNVILGGLQLLDTQNLNNEQKDTTAIINNGAQHLVTMLDQIMLLNQLDKGQVSVEAHEFNPLAVIAELLDTYEPIAAQKSLTLVNYIHHTDQVLYGDVAKIKQMISTILENAVKFTLDGEITIQSHLIENDQTCYWQISIEDTGIGIDSDNLDKIFDPFFQADSSHTRQFEGSGIGLTVVNQLAKLLGANVSVESTLDNGSQFTLRVPVSRHDVGDHDAAFEALVISYFHHEKTGRLPAQLEALGAQVHYHCSESAVIAQIQSEKVDMIMCAEDIEATAAASLAKHVRDKEKAHRTLIIYWYPSHLKALRHKDIHMLKSVGVDYCHNVDISQSTLAQQLRKWLAWI